MRVLGIDPGSLVAGLGLIESSGGDLKYLDHFAIELSKKGDFSKRLFTLGEKVKSYIRERKPDVVAIEKVFAGRNIDSAFKLGHARGVCLYEAAAAKLPIFEYMPREVKKGVTGMGGAEKNQVAIYVAIQLGLKPGSLDAKGFDATDALAIAIHHAIKKGIKI